MTSNRKIEIKQQKRCLRAIKDSLPLIVAFWQTFQCCLVQICWKRRKYKLYESDPWCFVQSWKTSLVLY